MRQSSSERASEGFRAREDLSPPQPGWDGYLSSSYGFATWAWWQITRKDR